MGKLWRMTIQLTAMDDCLCEGMFGFLFFSSSSSSSSSSFSSSSSILSRNPVFCKALQSLVSRIFSKDQGHSTGRLFFFLIGNLELKT